MMDNANEWDRAGRNEMRVPENDCGCVYRMPLDGEWSGTRFEGILCGKSVDAALNGGNRCDPNSIASPDNIAFGYPDML